MTPTSTLVCTSRDESCSDDGLVRCRGLCRKHYDRFLRTGGTRVQYHTRPRKAAPGEGWCAKCQTFKPVGAFAVDRSRKSGIKTTCRECCSGIARDGYDAERDWERRLRAKYGINAETYYAMLISQGGVCAVCEDPPPSSGKFHVDHSHDTGIARGLLCFRCNTTLGKVNDSPALLHKLIAYLGDC